MAMQAPLRGLLTWNVWFESSQFEARAAALFATVAARRPAVVALQEVTPRFLALLLREQVRGYFLVFVQLFEKYGTLIERYTALIEKVSALTVGHRDVRLLQC
eukprot:SAG31_NODE_1502_length_8080_cov_131.725849_6_plen_103_part_00